MCLEAIERECNAAVIPENVIEKRKLNDRHTILPRRQN